LSVRKGSKRPKKRIGGDDDRVAFGLGAPGVMSLAQRSSVARTPSNFVCCADVCSGPLDFAAVIWEVHMADVTKLTSGTLIAAEKVEGTNVYNLQDEKLGTVDDIMIDKVSGRVIYALMSFGGFLGIGEKYHPLPWSTLKYDERKGGYVVNLDKKMLENAPTYDMNSDFNWSADYGRQVDKYYNVPTYW
jgi:sporulation protein YlmC with PRC-barrel domain